VAAVTLARQRGGGGDVAGVMRRRQWQRDGDGGAATVEAAVPTSSSDARAFERHRHANVRAFVLCRGRMDDGADCVVVGNSRACGDVHRGHCSADEAEGDADDTIF
jgi:hypothetical protein